MVIDNSGVQLSKTTGISISIGLLVSVLVAVGAYVRADTNLRRDLNDLKAQNNALNAQLEGLVVQQADIYGKLSDIQYSIADRWTKTQQRAWARELREKNPGTHVPFADDF